MSSYTSPDEARSDLFLSGAAYVFGGTLFAIVLSITRLDRVQVAGPVLRLLIPIATTVLVPLLLMRYRGESLRDIGIGGGDDDSLVPGFLSSLPLVGAAVVAVVLAGGTPVLPGLRISGGGGFSLLVGLVQWLGLLFLALYGTVKARDAFRGQDHALVDAVTRVGRFVGLLAGVPLAILIAADLLTGASRFDGGDAVALAAYPLGVAAAVLLALRVTRGSATTTLPTVLTPTVLLGLFPFAPILAGAGFLQMLYHVAIFAGIGLVVVVLVERSRRGAGVLVLALVLALGTHLAGSVA